MSYNELATALATFLFGVCLTLISFNRCQSTTRRKHKPDMFSTFSFARMGSYDQNITFHFVYI